MNNHKQKINALKSILIILLMSCNTGHSNKYPEELVIDYLSHNSGNDLYYFPQEKSIRITRGKDTLVITDSFNTNLLYIRDTCIVSGNYIYCTLQSKLVKIDQITLKKISCKDYELVRLRSGTKFRNFSMFKKGQYLIWSRGIDLYVAPESLDTIYNINSYLMASRDSSKMYPEIGTYTHSVTGDSLYIKTGYFWDNDTQNQDYFTNSLYLPNDTQKLDLSNLFFSIFKPGAEGTLHEKLR